MSISSFTIKTKPKFKLILLGDQSVGKTCLIEQFVNGKFEDSETPTVGIDFVVTNISHLNRLYRLQLWDTAGQQRFKSLIPSYLRDSHCAIILYDATKKQSSENAFKWLDLFKDHVDENAAYVIVANKIDLKSRFTEYQRMKQKCLEMGIMHFEVSAKTGQNVKDLFLQVIDKIQEKLSKPILAGEIQSEVSMTKKGEIMETINQQQSCAVVKLSPSLHSRKNIEKSQQNARQVRNKCC